MSQPNAITVRKSPVLKNKEAFLHWCNESNCQPAYYPCIAVMFSGEVGITYSEAASENVQVIEFVYFNEFKFGGSGVLIA